jgi:hypothetical protein
MMKRTYGIFLVPAAFLALVILIAGCATVEMPRQADTEESLRNTASLYWKLRMAGKFDDTLKFEEKGQLSKWDTHGMSFDEYYKSKAQIASAMTGYSIKDAKVSDGKGRVDLLFNLILPEIPRAHQILTDEWVFKDGRWWHLFRL